MSGPRKDMPPEVRASGCFVPRIMSLFANGGTKVSATKITFLDDEGEVQSQISYKELWSAAGGIARSVRMRGAKPGDRVLLVYPPGLDFLVAFVACLRMVRSLTKCHGID
mmetsp:Transcript_14555/g.36833  ORF Transcript_14555/g.36833 Transcript_14555/m.36833 type:complete len:110 (+) Transcript_14555:69-398(+)